MDFALVEVVDIDVVVVIRFVAMEIMPEERLSQEKGRAKRRFFNSALLVPGQRVTIGGPFVNGAVTVKRVVLRHEGHTGTLVAGSANTGTSTFQFNSNGLAGILFNGPVTVYVTPFTRFGGGLTSLQDLTNNPTNPLRVIGIVLKDPISGQPVFVARSVVELTN